jgi:hypothetical protein
VEEEAVEDEMGMAQAEVGVGGKVYQKSEWLLA